MLVLKLCGSEVSEELCSDQVVVDSIVCCFSIILRSAFTINPLQYHTVLVMIYVYFLGYVNIHDKSITVILRSTANPDCLMKPPSSQLLKF